MCFKSSLPAPLSPSADSQESRPGIPRTPLFCSCAMSHWREICEQWRTNAKGDEKLRRSRWKAINRGEKWLKLDLSSLLPLSSNVTHLFMLSLFWCDANFRLILFGPSPPHPRFFTFAPLRQVSLFYFMVKRKGAQTANSPAKKMNPLKK